MNSQDGDFTSNFYSFFWHFAKKYKFHLFVFTFLFVFLSYTLNMFLTSYILKYFINNISTLSLKNGIFLLFLCSLCGANFLIYAIGDHFKFKSIAYVSEDMRNFLFKSLLKQSISYFDSKRSGEIINKINFIVSNVESIFRTTLFFIRNILVSVISIIIFCNYNLILGFLVLFFLVIYQIIGLKMLKIYTNRTAITNDKANRLTGFINDAFLNIINIKIFASNRREKRNISFKVNEIIKAEQYEYQQENLMLFVSFCFSVLIFGSVLFVLIHQLINGQINLGSFIFGAEITRHMFDIPSTTFEFMQNLGSKLKIFNDNLLIIKDKIKIKDKDNAKVLDVSFGKIVFRGVNFSYDRQ